MSVVAILTLVGGLASAESPKGRNRHPRVVVVGGGFAGLGAATTLQVL